MRGVACITSDRSVSLQRVCKDILKVFNLHGISDTKMILAADADPRHYRDVSFAITVMTYDPVWAVPYFYLARSLKIKGKVSLFYTTIEGKAKRTQFDYWVLRDLSFIANSNYTAERLREVGARIDAVVYHGVDIEEIQRYSYRRNFVRRWLGLKEDDFVVGYIAGCYPRKGHHVFPEAIKIVRERDPSIKFVVVTKEKCVDFYSGLDNVVVVPEFGQLTDDTIMSMYHAFDLYAQPSLAEGFGLPCLPPGTPIITMNGIKPIEEVREGDLVLTHEGRFMKVTKTMRRRYVGKVVKLRVWCNRGLELVLTPEHPVLAIRRPKKKGGKSIGRILTSGKVEIEWVPALELKKGDIVLFPIPKQLISVDHVDLHKLLSDEGIEHEYDDNYVWFRCSYRPTAKVSYSRIAEEAGVDINVVKYVFEELLPKGKEPRTEEHKRVIDTATRLGYIKPEPKKYPRYIRDLKKLARLLGYYTAEGSISSEGHAVELDFGSDEWDLVEDVRRIVKELFNDEPLIRERRDNNVIRVIICGIPYVVLAKQCGVGARNKRIPPWILYGDVEVLKEFIDAYLKGDGSRIVIRRNGKISVRINATTVSLQLVIDLKIAFARLGYKPSFRVNRRKDGRIEYEVNTIEDNRDVTHSNKSWFVGGKYIGFLIDEVVEEDYDGYVYNLEVEEDNSYTTTVCSVHNCLEALAAGKPVVHVDYDPLSEITDEKTSFRVPVMARDFKDEGGGILYELHYYDPKDLAQAILYAKDEVLKNREEYAARCLERAKIFDIRRVYKFFVDIYAKGEINEFSTREHPAPNTDIRVSFSA